MKDVRTSQEFIIKNDRRLELKQLKASRGLSRAEQAELEQLQEAVFDMAIEYHNYRLLENSN